MQRSSARTGMQVSADTQEPSHADHIVLANVPETADVIVPGTVFAAQRARRSLALSFLAIWSVTVNCGNRNCSPSASWRILLKNELDMMAIKTALTLKFVTPAEQRGRFGFFYAWDWSVLGQPVSERYSAEYSLEEEFFDNKAMTAVGVEELATALFFFYCCHGHCGAAR